MSDILAIAQNLSMDLNNSNISRIQLMVHEKLQNKATQRLLNKLQEFNSIKCSSKKYTSADIRFKFDSNDRKILDIFETLKPWRKGPFKINNTLIDSEWRSDLKWNRISKLVNWKNKLVLDVGAGNGYYLYRMIGNGADYAIGLDPHVGYYNQFLALNHFLNEKKVVVLPLGWQMSNLISTTFDVVTCMGVLYHQNNHLELLKMLFKKIKSTGICILETLIIPGQELGELKPTNTYAAMKNVYCIPTINTLIAWVKHCGFKSIDVVDITPTTSTEQRATKWSGTASLENFLDFDDPTKTQEGYPAPLRAILLLKK